MNQNLTESEIETLHNYKFDPSENPKLKKFLDTELNPDEGDYPSRLNRLIQIVRACLRKPKVLLIDQKALNLKVFEFTEVFNTIRQVLPNTSILMIMYTFEDILVTDRCYVMENGQVAEQGNCRKLILDKNSKLSQTMIRSDKKDWYNLYEEVGGLQKDSQENKEKEMISRQRNQQRSFREDQTDLMFGEAEEVSEKNVHLKIFDMHHSHLIADKVVKKLEDGEFDGLDGEIN